jgi:hypothetical protein
MAPPHSARKQMPVRRAGPLTTRAGVTLGLRARGWICTASKVAWSMSGGTSTERPNSSRGYPSCHSPLRLLLGPWRDGQPEEHENSLVEP